MKRVILITGGAGFVGSNLVTELIKDQANFIVVLDDLSTGKYENIGIFLTYSNFVFINCDISDEQRLKNSIENVIDKHRLITINQIYHLAAPASPPKYSKDPIKTIKTITFGTYNILRIAEQYHSTVLLASTSEVYGDPLQHPQRETYFGNVNSFGPRACYDESKRVAETLFYEFYNQKKVPIRIARIFNTYGPNMDEADGRVISNFIVAALNNEDMVIYGDGEQTRSFQYITDLIEGLIKLMNSNIYTPVNLGNPNCELTINQIAEYIKNLTSSNSDIINSAEVIDDPKLRKPDITLAKTLLNWNPKVSLEDGLKKTIEFYFYNK
jgi:UDP-glucuronate decarboxylase